MRRSVLLSLVAASAFLSAGATASTRPHYGGTLNVAMRDALTSLDPADSTQPASVETRGLSRLLFDTLVTLDELGRPVPALSSSWQAEPGNQRWRFNIRHGVTFQDGSPLGADAAAASLRNANPSWKVISAGEAVVIECGVPTANLPAILTLPRNAIVKRSGRKGDGQRALCRERLGPGQNNFTDGTRQLLGRTRFPGWY